MTVVGDTKQTKSQHGALVVDRPVAGKSGAKLKRPEVEAFAGRFWGEIPIRGVSKPFRMATTMVQRENGTGGERDGPARVV